MDNFISSEKYRLEIHWDRVSSLKNSTLKLLNCKLSGPVVQDLVLLKKDDTIRLDFSKQYIVIADNYYIVDFKWSGYKRVGNIIYLSNALLINSSIASMPTISANDYIVVDTSDHEDEKHENNLNYKSYLIKEDNSIYTFNG